MGKGKKKIIIAVVVLVAFFAINLIGTFVAMYATEKSDDAGTVMAFITAYQEGNYDEFKKYVCEDNQLNYLMAGVESDSTEGMAAVYKAVHDKTKNVVITAENVEGRERWGEVKVTIKTVDVEAPVLAAMATAINEQVENGGDSFANMPAWLLEGANNATEEIEKEFTVYVGCTEGENVLDTNTNRQFFDFLCGNYYQYIDITMTRCEMEGDSYDIASRGDEIAAMVETAAVPYENGLTKDNSGELAQAYADMFANTDGVVAIAEPKDEAIEIRLGIAFDFANSNDLYELGIVSERMTAGSTGYLSLSKTISGFESEGMTSTTEDFGSGVIEKSN